MYTSEASGMPAVIAPLARSSAPAAGALHEFSMHVVIDGITGLGIGSGAPKVQPVWVQSGAVLFGGGATAVGPTVQLEPAQPRMNRLVDPAPNGASPKSETPLPMYRTPHASSSRTAPDPSRVSPQIPPGVRMVKSR